LFDTKQFQEVLLSLTDNTSSYHDYLKSNASLNGKHGIKAAYDGFVASEARLTATSADYARFLHLN
jgi:molybdopterin-containing oxidoreductase family iron-sulfur binding subunit